MGLNKNSGGTINAIFYTLSFPARTVAASADRRELYIHVGTGARKDGRFRNILLVDDSIEWYT